MRLSLSILVVGLAMLVVGAAPAERPNVLVILTDDQRWDCLSCAGHPHLKTPHLDRLAREGVRFANAFCTTSLCSPSRASILSGRYARAHGVLDNFTDYPAELPSFPRALQSAGYETAYIGKWHMGEHSDDKRPGFDYFVTHKGQGQYFDTVFNFNGQDRRKVPGYYTHVVTEMAQKWLNQPREKPWMLILGHKAPHSFYIPEPKYAHAFDHVDFPYPESSKQLDGKPEWVRQRLTTWHGIYGPLFDFRKKFPDTRPEAVADFSAMIRAYLATLISVDDSVGMVLETLQQRGELDRTLILHLGDNGLLNGEHGMVDKRAAHEPSMRIPLLARYPGLTPTNKPQVVREQILTIDLSPTILDVCGLPPLPGTQGRSFRPLVSGATTAWRDSWVYEYNYEKQFPYTPNVRALRTDRWKYIRYPHGDGSPDRHKAELYDLQADPDELTNLIDRPEQAERVAALAQELDKRSREIGRDTMPLDLGIKQGLPDQAIR